MPLLLVHPAVDLTIELHVPPALEQAIALQWERVRLRTARETYVSALASRMEELLGESLDWDLKPPTDAQMAFARVLAARHGIEVPPEALLNRYQMALFLQTWASRPSAATRYEGALVSLARVPGAEPGENR